MYICINMGLHITLGVVMLVALQVDSEHPPDEPQPPINFKRTMRHSIESHAQSFGYFVTRHFIRTEDGYYLLYHRLTKGGKNNDNYLPVLLQHGILNSSGSFMAFRFSLAYLLVDSGFDVWMGNSRGNMYSRKHVKYDPDKHDRYWEFSFHEMGKYDIPAGIDYILKETKKDQLYYVGFSMGTTMYFVMGATRPEYMPKVKAMVALAPVVRPKNMALARNKVTFFFVRMLYSRTLESLMYFPSGTSIRTMVHFLQMTHAGKFQQYDFGGSKNFKKYRSTIPPQYDLRMVTSSIYLVMGDMDTLSVKEDVYWLMDQLPNRPQLVKTNCTDFCHEDFLYGKNAEVLLNKFVIGKIRANFEYSNTRVEETENDLRLTILD